MKTQNVAVRSWRFIGRPANPQAHVGAMSKALLSIPAFAHGARWDEKRPETGRPIRGPRRQRSPTESQKRNKRHLRICKTMIEWLITCGRRDCKTLRFGGQWLGLPSEKVRGAEGSRVEFLPQEAHRVDWTLGERSARR